MIKRESEEKNWKRHIGEVLRLQRTPTGPLIKEDYTGSVTINYNQGGITEIEIKEKIK